MEKKFEIKESTINAILQYLGKQPYVDVAQLIGALVTECNSQMQPPTQPKVSEKEV